jgi:hypothetical protein
VHAPLRFCLAKGCPTRVPKGYCAQHQKRRSPVHGSMRWRRLSKQFLARHPLCVGYPKGTHALPTMATCTDHKQSVHTHPELAYDEDNLQPMCDACNKRKAAAEERFIWW